MKFVNDICSAALGIQVVNLASEANSAESHLTMESASGTPDRPSRGSPEERDEDGRCLLA